MLMPETSVNQDRESDAGDHDVGASGQIAPVQPEAIALAVQPLPNDDFGFRIAGPYPRHVLTSRGGYRRILSHFLARGTNLTISKPSHEIMRLPRQDFSQSGVI
jgi:hypothetical protein